MNWTTGAGKSINFFDITQKIKSHNKNINTISNMNFHNKIFGFDINLLNEYFAKSIISYCKFNFDQSKKLKNLPFRNELIKNTSHIKIINDSKSTNLENSIIKINQINLKKKIIIFSILKSSNIIDIIEGKGSYSIIKDSK